MKLVQVNKTCAELCMGGVCNYSTSLPDFLQKEDCYYSWKSQDGTVLGKERFLTRDDCESGIHKVVRCLNPSYVREYIFHIFNSTTPTPEAANMRESMYTTVNPDPPQSQINTIISIVISIIVAILIVGMCYRKRRVIVGLGEKLIRGCCQRADENNRSDIPLGDIEPRNNEDEAQLNTSNTESDVCRVVESE
ncbi:uncharacterized protein LOC128616052 isoform X2 [Ictalurus furcatus]|uniref:uncharacterized protein LOC128616052 isoform X2 n=1 Tax=Ictalurus furcatus TaxID=66913 RepID=UPI002350ADF3|nr:uncharacterized protein LOC128616052 isoform X2 [Ictalurus furcatus]